MTVVAFTTATATDRQGGLVDPSPDSVIADSEQLGRLTDAQVGTR